MNDAMLMYFSVQGYVLSDTLAKGMDANIVYAGYVDRSGNWYITEHNITGGTYRYIKGTTAYTTAFSGREALVYDYFYNAFK